MLRQRKLRTEHGYTDWAYNDETGRCEDLVITIDNRIVGNVTLVIHELLHIYFEEKYHLTKDFAYEVQEALIYGLERELAAYLAHPPRAKLLNSWTKAIGRKLV